MCLATAVDYLPETLTANSIVNHPCKHHPKTEIFLLISDSFLTDFENYTLKNTFVRQNEILRIPSWLLLLKKFNTNISLLAVCFLTNET